MNEKEAREIANDPNRKWECLSHYAKGYLEAIEKAKILEECIDGLICGTCEAETAEEILRKWEKEK